MPTLLSFYDNNLADLITQVNAAFAPLLDVKVLAADVDVSDIERRDGIEFRVLIETDTGGAVMTDPFQLQIFTGSTLTQASDLAQAFIDANPTAFIAPPRLGVISLPRRLLTSFVALFYTEDAANGINNWLAPFVGMSGGGGEVNTASNLAAEGLFASKVGTDLRFKGLAATALTGLAVAGSPTQVTVSQSWSGLPAQGSYPTTGQFIVFNPNGSGDFRTLSVSLLTPPTPGGTNTNVQFNNAGTFGGSADLTWDDTGKVLLVDGKLTVTGLIDPTGVEFTPQLANPGGVAANTIWINSANNHLMRGAVDVENPAVLVTSVFGRTGAVVAVAGDYTSSQVTNLSSVVGATVTAALETLSANFANFVPITRTVTAGTGLTGGGALSSNITLNLANTAVTPGSYTSADITIDAQGRITAAASGAGGVSSVFGRTGNVLAMTGDYDSDLITNNSSVLGSSVTDALNNLLASFAPAAPDTSIQYNNGGIFGGDIGFSWDYTNRHLGIDQYAAIVPTQATAFSIISDWTSPGTTFRTSWLVFTDVSSAADSMPLVITKNPGSVDIFAVRKDGQVTIIADFVGIGVTTGLGSAATPAFRFTADPDTGLFSPGADQVALSTGGTQRLSVSTTAMTSTLIGVFPATSTARASTRLPHGTAPTSPVNGDLWSTTAGFFGRVNGVTVGPFGAGGGGTPGGADTQVQYNDGGVFGGDADFTWNDTTNLLSIVGRTNLADGAVGSVAYGFTSAPNTGMYAIATNDLGFSVLGTLRLNLTPSLATLDSGLSVTGQVTAGVGSGGAPSYSFIGDTTTGIYRSASGTIVLASSGSDVLTVSGVVTSTGAFRGPNGTVGAPAYTFASDTDTGMYRAADDQVGFSAGGVQTLLATATGVTVTGKLTVTGLIDPTGLELTPQVANPGGVAANTVWVETGVGWRFDNIVVMPATSTARASTRLPHGTAPTSPVNGDLWSTTAGFFGRVNGVTVGPFGAGGGGTPGGANTEVQFNDSGSFGGSANLTWDNGTNTLTSSSIVVGSLDVNSAVIISLQAEFVNPDYIQFDPMASNPYTAETLWSDSGNGNRLTYGAEVVAFLSDVVPAGADTDIQFNDAGVFGGSANFTWNDTNKTVAVDQGVVTAGTDGIRITSEWDNAADNFTGVLIDITDTNSASGDLIRAISGAVTFYVNKVGDVFSSSQIQAGTTLISNGSITAVTFVSCADIRLDAGAAATPAVRFSLDANTGIFSPGADRLAVTTGGTQRLEVSTTAVISTLQISNALGSAAAPAYSFTGDLDTGVYSPAADEVAIGGDGAQIARFIRTSGIPSLLLGATARLGSERLRVSGGSVPSGIAANDTEVAIGAGVIDAGEGIIGRSFGSGLNAALIARSDSPALTLYENDGAADAKMWTFFAFTEELLFRTVNDAGSTSNTWLSVARSGASPTRVSVGVTTSVVAGVASLATTATDGFLYVPTCAGTPTGVPTAQTGFAPIVVDSTNNKLYFYSGGAWRDAGP